MKYIWINPLTMIKKVLLPDRIKVIATLIALSLPWWAERITLDSGQVVVERVIPITILPVYLVHGADLGSFLLVLGFYVFVYVIVAIVVELIPKLLRK